jgi:hypothetical protein
MFRHLSFCLSLAALCACDALPSLPSESGERLPTEVRFTGLTIAEGFEGAGDAVNNDQILAGTAVQAGATVLAQDGQPLAGTLVQFGLKTERWREVFKLPQGASCVTNDDGVCFIILSNEGPAGAVDLEIKVPGLAPQVEALIVVPDASEAVVGVEVSGLGSFAWETGQVVDPLAGEDTLMVLDRDQSSGNLVQVRLRDQFGNALPGRSVRLAVLQDGEEPPVAPGAGPAGDVGAGAAADTGAMDSGTIDSGTAADTGQSDAGRAGDAAIVRGFRCGAPAEEILSELAQNCATQAG